MQLHSACRAFRCRAGGVVRFHSRPVQRISLHLNKPLNLQTGINLPACWSKVTDAPDWLDEFTPVPSRSNWLETQILLIIRGTWSMRTSGNAKNKAFICGGNLGWILDLNPSSSPVSVSQGGSRALVRIFYLTSDVWPKFPSGEHCTSPVGLFFWG